MASRCRRCGSKIDIADAHLIIDPNEKWTGCVQNAGATCFSLKPALAALKIMNTIKGGIEK
jgi:pentose-5-phosphate-3-epimerase